MAIVFLSCFSHKVIKVTLMTYRKNNPRIQQPLEKPTWNQFHTNKHEKLVFRINKSLHQGVLFCSPPYMYFSPCKMSMANISPVQLFLLHLFFVIYDHIISGSVIASNYIFCYPLKKLYSHFLWMGFNCQSYQGQSHLEEAVYMSEIVPRNLWYSYH